MEELETRTLLSAVAWTGAGGDLNWNNAANWNTDATPSSADDVTIGDLGGATITVSGTAVTINSLHTSGALDVSGSSFTLAANSISDLGASLRIDAGGSLNVNGSVNVVNGGAIAATGGTVNFDGTWSDSAPITLTGGTLNFFGTGTITSTIGGDASSAVEFYGAITTVNVTGGARVGLYGGTLHDGTLTLDPGRTLHVDRAGTLSNLTLDGNLDVTKAYNNGNTMPYVNVTNGLTLNGTAYVGAADASTWGGINFDGMQTIGGTGSIVFGSHPYNYLDIATSASTVTFGPNLTVHGVDGKLAADFSDSSLVNQGTIASDGGGRIDVGNSYNQFTDRGSLVNQGTLTASNNGFLYVHTDS